jgi:hypothetical protein
MAIEKNDERVLAVQQIVDLIKDILDITATCVPKCHGSEFPLRNLRARRSGHGRSPPLLHGLPATRA